MFEIEMNDNVQYMVIEPMEIPEREIPASKLSITKYS